MRGTIRSVLAFGALLLTALPMRGQTEAGSDGNRLLRLLEAKGVITGQEFAAISLGATADEVPGRLAQLLIAKG